MSSLTRSRWRCGRVPRSPVSTSATPSRSTSWSGASARTRSPTTPSTQGLDAGRGRALAVAEPRLRPGGLTPERARPPARLLRRGPVGHGRHPGRHRAVPGPSPSSRSPPSGTTAPGRAEHGLGLVGSDLVDAARLHPRAAWASTCPPEQIVEEPAGLGGCPGGRVRCRGDAGARGHCSPPCASDGVPCALVTMSYARFREAGPGQAPAARDTFLAAVVTGDEVDRGKPHPEPYLAAARDLDVLASECLAIEDSDTGTRSAAAPPAVGYSSYPCTCRCRPDRAGCSRSR